MDITQAIEVLTETELVYQKANEYSRRHQPRKKLRTPSPVRRYGAEDYVDLSDSDKSERRSIDLADYTVTPPPLSPPPCIVYSDYFHIPKAKPSHVEKSGRLIKLSIGDLGGNNSECVEDDNCDQGGIRVQSAGEGEAADESIGESVTKVPS